MQELGGGGTDHELAEGPETMARHHDQLADLMFRM